MSGSILPPPDDDEDAGMRAGCALLALLVTFLLCVGVTCGLIAGCAFAPPPASYTAERACVRQCAIAGDEGRAEIGPHVTRCVCRTVGGIEWRP